MSHLDNIQVFENTVGYCTETPELVESIRQSRERQVLTLETDEVPDGSKTERFSEPAKIIISKKRTFEAAQAYAGKGDKVCVLNFASSANPGGGVTNGSSAQEESLCRVSTLYFCLDIDEMWEKFYMPHRALHSPLHNDDIIYTPGVVVFKSDDYKDYGTTKNVNIITCAAPNLRENPKNEFNSENTTVPATISDDDLLELHKQRGRKILSVAAANKNDYVVLGAFGCGAFRNDPKIVAEAYKQILPEFKNAFKVIEFAVFCRDHETINYDTFKEILNG